MWILKICIAKGMLSGESALMQGNIRDQMQFCLASLPNLVGGIGIVEKPVNRELQAAGLSTTGASLPVYLSTFVFLCKESYAG